MGISFYHACPGYADSICHCFHPYAIYDGKPFPNCNPCPNPNYDANARALPVTNREYSAMRNKPSGKDRRHRHRRFT